MQQACNQTRFESNVTGATSTQKRKPGEQTGTFQVIYVQGRVERDKEARRAGWHASGHPCTRPIEREMEAWRTYQQASGDLRTRPS